MTNPRGTAARADCGVFPRTVYSDPPVAARRHASGAAEAAGLDDAVAGMDLAETERTSADGTEIGRLELVAGRTKGVLVGAAALAVRAKVPLELLAEVVHSLATYSEAYEPPLRDLVSRLSQGRTASRNVWRTIGAN